MNQNILRQLIAALTALALTVQAVVASPNACACGASNGGRQGACCREAVTVASCCETASACCRMPADDRDAGASSAVCRCGCEVPAKRTPAIPAERSERGLDGSSHALAVSQLDAFVLTQAIDFHRDLAVMPYARSGPHAIHALLCTWRI